MSYYADDRDELRQALDDDMNTIVAIIKNDQEMLKYIRGIEPFIFKRSIAMPKKLTRDKDIDDEFATGRWSDSITLDDGTKMRLRNKYKDTIGDSTYIQLLNYILGFKGNYRISGYADYDLADATQSGILKETNICGDARANGVGVPVHACKEIMLLDPSKYLTYLGACDIEQFDTTNANATNALTAEKTRLWQKISTKLNSLIKNNAQDMKIEWVTQKEDVKSDLFNDAKGIYEKIRIFPHYRFKDLTIAQIDNIVSHIEKTENNTIVSINTRHPPNPPHTVHTVFDLSKPPISQVGGAGVDDDDNSVEMTHILSELKVLSPNSSGHVYSADVYKALYQYMESMNPVAAEDEESKDMDMTDEMIQQKKYKIKTDISDVITKTLHKDNAIHQGCITGLAQLCNTVREDLATRSTKIQAMYDALKGAKFNTIHDGTEKLFSVYLKGSSALDLLILHDTKYAGLLTQSPALRRMREASDLKNSDFDINVCINPKIMDSDSATHRPIIKKMVVEYFNGLLQTARTKLMEILTQDKLREKFASVNKSLLMQVHQAAVNADPINVIVGDMHYAYEKFGKDTVIIKDLKTSKEEYPTSSVNISGTEITSEKLNNFYLLRLKVLGSSGKQHINCHGELLDISIIDDLDEATFTWPHCQNIIELSNGIYVNDLKGLYLDLNNTLLNNLVLLNKSKSMKRFIRLEFVHKLLCLTLENADPFFKQIRNVVHDDISKNTLCSYDNNIRNLVEAVRLLAPKPKPRPMDDMDNVPPLVTQNDAMMPQAIAMGHEINSQIELDRIDVLDVDPAEVLPKPKPKPKTSSSKPRQSDSSKIPVINASAIKIISQRRNLISQQRNLISQQRNLISQLRNLISQQRNTLAMQARLNSTDIRQLIKNNILIEPSQQMLKEQFYLMFLLMYGQLDINNKILIVNPSQFNYIELRSIYDKYAIMLDSLGNKVIDLFVLLSDNNLIYTRYLKQPINIISSFSNINVKTAHKIQSILNTKSFKNDIATIVKNILSHDNDVKVFQKISNIDESMTDGWGDNFTKINNAYFIATQINNINVNIHLFNYQIIINTTSTNKWPASNIWRSAPTLSGSMTGGRNPDSTENNPPVIEVEELPYLPNKSVYASNLPVQTSEVLKNHQSFSVDKTNFNTLYEPTVQDSCYAIAIFFPLEIPESMHDSVHMILLGDMLSGLAGILDEPDPKNLIYLDIDDFIKALDISTSPLSHKGGLDNRLHYKKNMQIYADNKNAYLILNHMNK
jgi:hypothetical protein